MERKAKKMLKVYRGNPEAYRTKQENKQKKKIDAMIRMSGRAMSCFQTTGDRWELMKAVYGISEVCLAARAGLNGNGSAGNNPAVCHLLLYWIGKITPKEFMLVFPPAKTYDGSRFDSKDYYSTMDLLKEFQEGKPLGDRAIDFVFGYFSPKVCRLGVMILKSIAHEYQQQEGQPMIDGFAKAMGKEPLTQYHIHKDSNGKTYMIGSDGSVARARKCSHLHLAS